MKHKRAKSHVEVETDGTWNGSRVYLVVTDGKNEQRFEIPNISSLELEIGGQDGGIKEPVLHLHIGKPMVAARVSIAHGKCTVEDLMAEIAAAKLRGSDR